jgi:hypothetical protein
MSSKNLESWREALISDQHGKVWWYNLQFDLAHNNLPSEINDLFMKTVREQLEALEDYASPLDLLKLTPSSFPLQGKRSPEVEPFSRVLDAYSFAKFNIDWEGLGLDTERLEDQVWNRFRKGKIVPERDFSNYMKTGGDFFWGTPTRRLEEVFDELGIESPTLFVTPAEKGDQAATEIRNLLGLSYHWEGIGLYRIDIPSKYLNGVRFCAPTTLDSSPICVFLPADEDTPFGCTLHLDKLEPGAEEVVIGALEFTAEYKVTQLGFIRKPLPDDAAVWAALEGMVEKRHGEYDKDSS